MNPRELRTPILIAVLLIGGSILLGYLSARNNEDWGAPSSYSARQYGAKAAYLLLLQSGYKVERWSKPPEELPKDAHDVTLVLAGAEHLINDEQGKAIGRFVRSGGRLIITGWPISYTDLPHSLANAPIRVGFAECKPAAPTSLTRARAITQEGSLYWDASVNSQAVHYRDAQGHAVVVSYPLGQGEVIWWSSALPLTNIGIREKGNLDLLLYALGGSRRILWDEYFHTTHNAARAARYAMILRWGEWQAALLGLVMLFAYARRSGPIIPLARPSRLSPLEFVQTMGSVFHKADARLAPLEIGLARLQQLAARRLALPPNVSPEAIAEAMRRRGYGVTEELAHALRAAQDATYDPGLKESASLKHARTIHQVLALLEREQRRNV